MTEVDLALLPRRRFEPHRRPLRRLLHGTQRTHDALHRLIAPAIPARPAQLLKENARRVLHLGGAGAQEARVLGEQRVRTLGARVRLPRELAENAAHCLAIELQLPGDLGLRPPLRMEQPMHLAPAVLPNHASLPEWCDLGASVGGGRRRARQQCLRHDDALLREEGGEFSMTTSGDYWVTADTQELPRESSLLAESLLAPPSLLAHRAHPQRQRLPHARDRPRTGLLRHMLLLVRPCPWSPP